MTPKAASILRDPHPQGHIVYPYTDEQHIAGAVSMFAAGGLMKQEAVVLITTPSHGKAIESSLQNEGFDIERLKKDGQLTLLDAEELLRKLLGSAPMPDPSLFRNTIGGVIDTAKLHAPTARVRLFGEMVNLLWAENLPATVRLEELWNDVVDEYSVCLLCSYSLSGHAHIPEALSATHSHNIAA